MQTTHQIKQMRNHYLFVHQIKQSLSKTLGILPFLTIGNLSVGSSLRISGQLMGKTKFDVSYFLILWSELTVIAIVHIILIVFTTKIRDNENEMHKSIVRKIYDRLVNENLGNDFKVYLILDEMEKIGKDVEFDAWNMFNIDKKLVLSILSFIIPFTVMIIQFNY